VAIQRSWDRTDPRNSTEYLKSGFINTFPSSLVDTLVEHYETFADRGTTVFFQHSGGAIGRVPADATAFAHRKSLAAMFIVVSWPLGEPGDSHIAYARQKWEHLEPYTDGWYTNEIADQSASEVNSNYQGNYQRLVQVKNRYDPTNLFRLNANIRPTV
jgi:FAD/FMN-containing dehydrogenase